MENKSKFRHFIEGEQQNSTTDYSDEYESEDEHRKKSIKFEDEVNSVSSISTSILDDAEEMKAIRAQLCQSEEKCRHYEREVNQISAILKREKQKNEKLEKKLQFVKDHQEVFMRLKEAYINMKYNEAAGRKMIEIREKGSQTWEGILCRGCLEAEQLRRNIESFRQEYKDSFMISSGDMDRMNNTIKYLKDLIARREHSWTTTIEREIKFQNHLRIIEDENSALRKILQSRSFTNDQSNEVLDEIKNNELSQFKKIIIKFEKRFRELEKLDNEDVQLYTPSFNDKEKKIIQHLMDKYYAKCGQKLKSRSISVEPRSDDASSRPQSQRRCHRRPKSRDSTNNNCKIKITNKCQHDGDFAMNMVDYLLENNTLY